MNLPAEARQAAPARAPMTALVTGGGGFLGGAIVNQLLARGDRVRSFARNDYPDLRRRGVETLQGDLADAQAVEQACAGCDVVFHAAARPGVWGPRDDYFRANVIGTDNVIAGCLSQNVPRLVHTSSPSVVFDGRDMEGVDESVPYPRHFQNHYSATKARAEQRVLCANSEHLRTVALRPHLIWGPGDNHITPRLIARARAGQLRRVGDGSNKVDTTFVENAAAAHLCAADALERNPRAAGRAFFISDGQPAPLWEIVDRILAAAGLPRVQRSVSPRTAFALGGVLESIHMLTRRKSEPRMTRFVALELSKSHWFDISAARVELGYEPRVSLDEGFERLRAALHGRDEAGSGQSGPIILGSA